MILYHGTNADFGDIDLTKSKPNKDFGQSATCVASLSNTSSALSVPSKF